MPDQPTDRKFTLRDGGVALSMFVAIGTFLYTAGSRVASTQSTSAWQEARITSLEQWRSEVNAQLHSMDKKLDRHGDQLDAIARATGAKPQP